MMNNIAFVFPGQGAQYVGMGNSFLDKDAIVQATFDEADEALGERLSDVIFNGPEQLLQQTEYTQPAILTVSVAMWRLLEKCTHLTPAYVAGHSLGEYSALVAAGCLSFTDAVRIVRQRGRLMEHAVPAGTGTMAAIIGLTHEEVADLCTAVPTEAGSVQPATLNAPGQTVVAGTRRAVDELVMLAKQAGARMAVPLAVSGPFHTALLEPAGEALGTVLQEAQWNRPSVHVVTNVSAEEVDDVARLQRELVAQVSSPVQWEASVRYMIAQGVDTIVEIGPGNVLTGLIRRIDRGVHVMATDSPDGWDKVLAWAKGDGII